MNLVKENLGKVSITVEKDYWSASKSYDRLVIVEVLNVGCYISRRAVPRGKQYDDREYWIRLSKYNISPTPQPGGFPIVTDFGDSVEVAVAQKTITDKLDEVDTNLTLLRETDDGLSDSIQDTRTTLSREINYVKDDILSKYNDYLRYCDEANGQINDLDVRLGTQQRNINEINTNVVNVNEKLNKIYRKLNDNEFIQYSGGRITDVENDRTYINKLKELLHDDTLSYNVYSAIEFDALLPNIEYHIERDISRIRAWVIQYDTKWKTIGTTADIPARGTEDYTTLYSGLVSIIDKINDANPNCRIFLVAPPNAPIDSDPDVNDNIAEKITALEEICSLTNAIFVNPNEAGYHPRYSEVFVESEVYTSTHTYIPVINTNYIDKWSAYLINKILETL